MLGTAGRAQVALSAPRVDGAALPGGAAPARRTLLAAAVLALVLAFALYASLGAGRSSIAPAPARSHGLADNGLLSLPLAAQGPVSATLGRASAAYRVVATDGGFSAWTPAQHLRSHFTSSGVSVASGSTRVSLSLRAFGAAGSTAALRSVAPRAEGSRVVYAHRGLSEWFANGPLGIEQGFTVARAPVGTAARPITLSLALAGNVHASLADGGESVQLTRGGRIVLRYTGLSATDARGRVLHSWLTLERGRLAIHVDAAQAAFPVRVDPFVQQGELTASGGPVANAFGTSVAISGNTLVVGAYGYSGKYNAGHAYVFVRPASGWANATQTAELTATNIEAARAYADGKEEEPSFGSSVAIAGNTIVVGAPGWQEANPGKRYVPGTAYVYAKPAGGWGGTLTQTAQLTPSDGYSGADFGSLLAASGTAIFVGAQKTAALAGTAVYVFEMPAGGWTGTQTQTAELMAGTNFYDLVSMAASSSTVAAGGLEVGGSHGSEVAYAWGRPSSGWANTTTASAELLAGVEELRNKFGWSVAVSENTAAAGAPEEYLGGNSLQGAVYVYVMPTSGWSGPTSPTATLTAYHAGLANPELGGHLAFSGSTIVAGGRENFNNEGVGVLDVYSEPAGGWVNMTQTGQINTGNIHEVGSEPIAVTEGSPGEPPLTIVAGASEKEFVFGDSPPTVTSGSATELTTTTATLGGTVNPNGLAVSSCVIEYGKSTSYGASEPCTPALTAGNSAEAVSAPASGLSANTTYHYRVVAASVAGTGYGADKTFTTLPNPPTVLTGSANEFTHTYWYLHGTVNPNGASISECKFEYGTSLPSATSEPCSPTPGSGTTAVAVESFAEQLKAGTTYEYRVVAKNSGGTSTGLTQTLTTVPLAATLAGEPASAITATSATVNGTVNPHGGTLVYCDFEVYGYDLNTVKECTPPPGPASTAVPVSANVTGLLPNQTYNTYFYAGNAGGGGGVNGNFTTLTEVPSVVTEGASEVGSSSAELSGSVNPNGANVFPCEIEYGIVLPSLTKVPCLQSPGAGYAPVAVTGLATGLSPQTTYQYRVLATNNAGPGYGNPAQSFTTTSAPPEVETTEPTSVGPTSATLNGYVNPNGSNVTSCEVEYGTSLPSSTKAACSPEPGSGTSEVAVSATVTGLSPNTLYEYRIVATNGGGTSTSPPESFYTAAESPTVGTLGASGITLHEAVLSGGVNPNGSNVFSCEVEYGQVLPSLTKAPCNAAPGSGNSSVPVAAAVSGLSVGTTYEYRFVASNAGGTSYGPTLSFTTPTPPSVQSEGSAGGSVTFEPVSPADASIGSVSAKPAPPGLPTGAVATVGELSYEITNVPAGGQVLVRLILPGHANGVYKYNEATKRYEGYRNAYMLYIASETYLYVHLTDRTPTSSGEGDSDPHAGVIVDPLVPVYAFGVPQVASEAPIVEKPYEGWPSVIKATFNGTVNPSGQNVSDCHFEYGPTISYGTSVPCSLPGSGAIPVAVSAQTGELTEGGSYHFRLVATNAEGTTYGPDGEFQANVSPPFASLAGYGGPREVSGASAFSIGQVNPYGEPLTNCQYRIAEVGQPLGSATPQTCTSWAVNWPFYNNGDMHFTGLTEGVRYHYQLIATTARGSTYSNEEEFTAEDTAPTVYTEYADEVTPSKAHLEARINPDGKELTECEFEYGSSLPSGKEVACDQGLLAGDRETLEDVTATIPLAGVDEPYQYRLVTRNAVGAPTGYWYERATGEAEAAAPEVETSAAEEVLKTQADLVAYVSLHGGNVTACHFEVAEVGISLSSPQAQQVPCQYYPEEESTAYEYEEVFTEMHGLKAGKKYHYALFIENPTGAETGNEVEFQTEPGGPTIERLPASQVRQTTATLNADVNPHANAVETCYFEYGTALPSGKTAKCIWPSSKAKSNEGPVAVYALIGGLTANTEYKVKVYAKNAEGPEEEAMPEFTTEELPKGPTVESQGTTVHGPVEVAAPPGVSISTLTNAPVAPGAAPSGAEVVIGELAYKVNGVPVGGSEEITINLPSHTKANNIYKVENGQYVDAFPLHARFTNNDETIILTVQDGGFGDEDATANGVIVDPVVPVYEAKPPKSPEVGRCTALEGTKIGKKTVYTGMYATSSCISKSPTDSGRYEWTQGYAREAITGAGGASTLQTAAGARVSCKTSTSSASYTGAAGETARITFKGCTVAGSKVSCQSTGHASGVIASAQLTGTFGFIDAPQAQVGLDLAPSSAGEPDFAVFECGGTPEHLEGSVIAEAAADKMSNKLALKYVAGGGLQLPQAFEGEADDTLTLSSGPTASPQREAATLIATMTDTSEEPLEVKALLATLTLAASPTSASAGTAVKLTGTGYIPGDTLALSFADHGVKTTLPNATAGSSGEFETEYTIPPSAAEGAAEFTLKSARTGLTVVQKFEVTPVAAGRRKKA